MRHESTIALRTQFGVDVTTNLRLEPKSLFLFSSSLSGWPPTKMIGILQERLLLLILLERGNKKKDTAKFKTNVLQLFYCILKRLGQTSLSSGISSKCQIPADIFVQRYTNFGFKIGMIVALCTKTSTWSLVLPINVCPCPFLIQYTKSSRELDKTPLQLLQCTPNSVYEYNTYCIIF